MRRTPLSIRHILLLTVSALTLLIALLVAREIYTEWQRLNKIVSLRDAKLFSDRLFDATEKLAVERDVAFALLRAPDNQETGDLTLRLKDSRRDADAAFAATLTLLERYRLPGLGNFHSKIASDLRSVRILRQAVDQAIARPKAQRDDALAKRWYDEVTALIIRAQDLWTVFIRHFTDIHPVVTQHLRYRHFLRIVTDYSGRERSLIGRFLVEHADAQPEEVGQLLRWQGMIELGWKTARLLADQSGLYGEIGPYFKDAESHYQTMYDMVRDLFYRPGGTHSASYPIGVDLWFELSTQSMDSLGALKEASDRATHRYVEKLERESRRAITFHLAVFLAALALCIYCFHVISRRVIRPINAMVLALVDVMQGKAVSLAPSATAQQDEIGKLAEVLDAFQQNTQRIKSTSIMLENYVHALERSNKELDDFAYIASHDLKEPLRGIHNHSCFLLEDNQEKLDPDSVKKLGRLVYLSQRMERLVNDLLYFSRLGRQELAVQRTDMNEVLHDIEGTLGISLEERGAHLVIHPLPVVTCDKPRVTEVFRNLITNALKYNDRPERIVEIGFLPEHPEADGEMRKNVFYVKDNGKGIPAEFHEEIFRIFRRLESGKDPAQEGTGVGLTFVKKIIERHGGRIWLESEMGAGTIFYFTLEEADAS